MGTGHSKTKWFQPNLPEFSEFPVAGFEGVKTGTG